MIPDLAQHTMNTASVRILVIFSVFEELLWEASTTEVIRDGRIGLLRFKVLVRMLNEISKPGISIEANEI